MRRPEGDCVHTLINLVFSPEPVPTIAQASLSFISSSTSWNIGRLFRTPLKEKMSAFGMCAMVETLRLLQEQKATEYLVGIYLLEVIVLISIIYFLVTSRCHERWWLLNKPT